MKPRNFLMALGLLTALTTLSVHGVEAAKPNILLIIADDLNDWISPMGGHPQAKTPNLDRLAARGVTFMNAHCAAPLCNPSRTAFMSGKRPSTTGIYHNHQVWMPHIERGLCINDYFRKHGFKSYAAGKIFHYQNYRPEEWDEVSYVRDDTLPMSIAERAPGPFGYRMFTEGEPQAQFQEKREEAKLVDAQSVSWCLQKLNQTNRFFMACGLHRPHTPWDVPKKYFDMYPLETLQLPKFLTNDLEDVPKQGKEFANPGGIHQTVLKAGLWKDRVRAYLAAVSFADAQVGRLLDALDKSAHKANTIVVFVGDNGWHLGEKEHWAKVTLWAESARVPLIWVAPGVTKPGTKCVQGVDAMSLYPTLCDLAGVPVPAHAEGANIRPLLANPALAWEQPALTTMYKDNHTLTTAEWRYIRYADGTEELYDIKKDLNEWTNLAGKSEFKSIKDGMAKYLPKVNAEPVEPKDPAEGEKKKKKRRDAKRAATAG